MDKKFVEIFTDGACSGNPGPGGWGAVLLIYLSLFKNTDQLTAQGINLMFFIPIALLSVIIYAFKKQIRWKTVIWFSVSGLGGAAVGVWLSGLAGNEIVAKIFGGLLILMGGFQVITSFKNNTSKNRD